ncbi:MAG: B12-binding domain-containing radical SAM protein [bacterium]|nr:B12-binding domain-containing radical SAM protein [bacterium]
MVYAHAETRRRIRLINPNCSLSTITMPELIRHMTFSRKAIFAPVGLAVCAGVVPDDWQVEIVDECTQDSPHRPVADVDVVGITAMTTQAKRAYELADTYRELGVTVWLGGIHPSALPEDALPHGDAVCLGDGETCLPHMIADWEANQRTGGNGHAAPGPKKIYDWKNYPTAPIGTPRKDLLDPADYLIFNPIQTTRGCPHSCNFCTTPGVFGRKFRQRPIADIIEEIREAKERYKSWCFIFADDDFGGNHKWALELCAAIEPLGIRWASQCDILISKNDRLLAAMKRSGCLGLILGLESPNQTTLSEAGKRFVKADTYERRIRKIQSYGISLWGAFIFGFDSDTWRTCMATCRFAQRMNLSMSCYPILTPYPGTGVWQEYRRQGRLVTEDWDRYNGASVCYRPERMTARQLRHAQMAAFAEFYSVPSACRRLGVLPFKKFAWLANLAIWRGIRYYYSRKGRRVPVFADFLHPHSRAWRYRDTWADQHHGACCTSALTDLEAADEETLDHATNTVAALNVAHTDPLVQAAVALDAR